jgi:hypothetical protein
VIPNGCNIPKKQNLQLFKKNKKKKNLINLYKIIIKKKLPFLKKKKKKKAYQNKDRNGSMKKVSYIQPFCVYKL